uniref:Uncharacterized protein n=1 Tax=Anguilla anguilla TaxID=7936 RepID=A0A0E9R603_ANGAN
MTHIVYPVIWCKGGGLLRYFYIMMPLNTTG